MANLQAGNCILQKVSRFYLTSCHLWNGRWKWV